MITAMIDKQKAINTSKGLAYGLLIGWIVGIVWWTSLVIIFGLQPAVTVVTVDSTGRHETWVTVLERFALIPVRAIPWAVIAGVAGAVVGSNRSRPVTGKRSRPRRSATGLAYGLLIGWVVGILCWTSLAIAFGPTGSTYEHGGVIRVEHYYPVLERLAQIRWTVVPWAVVGAIVGAIVGWIGGWLEIITCLVGMVSGIFVAISGAPFDGWLALTIPIYAFAGIGIGVVVGAVIRAVIKVFVGTFGR